MSSRFVFLLAMLCLSSALHGQTETATAKAGEPARFQVYGGYSYLTNSLNGVPGAHHALSGWDASFGFPSWHNLRFKLDVSSYQGTNLGAPQHPYFILGGGQYNIRWKRETVFIEGMGGTGGANKQWGTNFAVNTTGATASFAALAGGGLDTPITRHTAVRVEGAFQYSYFSLNGLYSVPYRNAGLPTEFGRLSGGLVWLF